MFKGVAVVLHHFLHLDIHDGCFFYPQGEKNWILQILFFTKAQRFSGALLSTCAANLGEGGTLPRHRDGLKLMNL